MAFQPDRNRNLTLNIPSAAIGTSGSPADRGSVSLPVGVTKWLPTRVVVKAVGASSTLAAGVIDLRTASGGGGSSILSSPLTLSTLTGAADLVDTASLVALVVAASALHLRQVTNSLFAGNIMVVIEYLDLS